MDNKEGEIILTAKEVVGVSRTVLMGILSEMHVWLSEVETEELYRELLAYFGLIGALNECQALKNAWKDPYNRHEIQANNPLRGHSTSAHVCGRFQASEFRIRPGGKVYVHSSKDGVLQIET